MQSIEDYNIHLSWLKQFINLEQILIVIEEKRKNIRDLNLKIYPEPTLIFSAFNYFKFNETRVVIVGQDPYHGKGQATGLAFGIQSGNKIPPSLRNISNELRKDLGKELQDITLRKWANQGVLLLNASLTVVEGKPGSHISIWREFTEYLIDSLNKLNSIVFVAWGAFAYDKIKNVDRNRHCIVVSSHPSPLSFKKNMGTHPSFYGSSPFSKINNHLLELGHEAIDW